MKTNMHMPLLAALTLGLCKSGPAAAATGRWDTGFGPGSGDGATSATPWIASPGAGSLYAEWNFFGDDDPATLLIEDSTPDIASFGLGGGTARLGETSGGAFVTSGGNIYSPSVVSAFTVSTPGLAEAATVLLRVSTLGSLLSTTATLNGIGATAQETFSATITGGFGGAEKDWVWSWTLPAAAASYEFAFESAASSVSLDQTAVFAAPVPEPGTYAMFGLGLLAVAFGVRKRAG